MSAHALGLPELQQGASMRQCPSKRGCPLGMRYFLFLFHSGRPEVVSGRILLTDSGRPVTNSSYLPALC